MSDRYEFSDPRRDPDGGWFQLGDIPASTTLIGTAFSIAALFASAISGSTGSFNETTWLSANAISQLEAWRIITWPLATQVSLWSFLAVVVFYLIGSQLEMMLGKERMLQLLAGIVVVPAAAAALLAFTIAPDGAPLLGWHQLNLGLIITFATVVPSARFFFRIPAWGFAVALVALQILLALANRQFIEMFYTIGLAIFVVAFVTRVGLAHESVSKILPTPLAQKRTKPKLTVAAPPVDESEMNRLLDKLNSEGLSKQEKKRLKELSDQLKNN